MRVLALIGGLIVVALIAFAVQYIIRNVEIKGKENGKINSGRRRRVIRVPDGDNGDLR